MEAAYSDVMCQTGWEATQEPQSPAVGLLNASGQGSNKPQMMITCEIFALLK